MSLLHALTLKLQILTTQNHITPAASALRAGMISRQHSHAMNMSELRLRRGLRLATVQEDYSPAEKAIRTYHNTHITPDP
jgi:hypothetical protein